MKIHINGEETEVSDSLTITQLLVERDVEMPDMVSVELNSNILVREKFDVTVISDGDMIEFLYFMGGGAHV